MIHLIDKDVLVEEITHKIKVLEAFVKKFDGISDKVEKAKNKIEALSDALLFIETLEAKEVGLEKEFNSWYYHLNIPENYNIPQIVMLRDIIEKTAKHFFELGLNAQKGE